MIQNVSILLLILFCQNIFCQELSLENNTITIIENKKANFLYRGIKNTIRIHMTGTDSINVDHVSIKKKLGNGEFVIIPRKEDEITLIIKGYNEGKEIVDERTFRVIDIIRLHGSINGVFKTLKIEKEQLLKTPVECVSPNFIYSPPTFYFRVYAFTFEINGGKAFKNEGNIFEDKYKDAMLKLKKGDRIYIYDIRASHRGISSIRIKRPEPIHITIK